MQNDSEQHKLHTYPETSHSSDEDHDNQIRKYAVNDQLVNQVVDTLGKLGIPKPKDFIISWNEKSFHVVSLFHQACTESELSIDWSHRQL